MSEFVRLRGGHFRMGADQFYPEEGPEHDAWTGPFEIARHAVTNREFAAFVEATGYVTVAERPIDPAAFPGAGDVEPGSLVFTPTQRPVDLRDWRQWWRWVPGASWRHPRGAAGDLEGREDHPVVQIAYADALAFAEWSDSRLPTEVEWEFAARGGMGGATYVWGEEPNDGSRANTWQGRFPYLNRGARGWVYTAPVGSFPPNGYGLHEMTGNTWEWTSTPWSNRHQVDRHRPPTEPAGRQRRGTSDGHCCAPQRDTIAESRCHGSAGQSVNRVLKGGSHLCSPEYCLRYRPAARSAQSEDSATTHIGLRLARDT
ncbi:formylglycine-generating enzyme family protein [Streptomyces acidicola]|uniref:Formylglycine-generating enzyme family protein n=1 Tax=Streptomyces acidicola TaxID=2596892 RepID=A0A5N8WN22_9ACTN|nr:formylglycine-generating enzyme family protein [Streptomyces acidicola]MPY48841.1 formylglycine-generating enzyme family protein [Streptomyces acidicola]